MKSWLIGLAAFLLALCFFSFKHDYSLNALYLNDLRHVCEEASVAGTLFIDTVEFSGGRIVFNKTESIKAIEAVIKSQLRLDDNFNPTSSSFWTDKITYKAYFFDDSNTTYPFLYVDSDTNFTYLIKEPTIVVTINAGKARYSLKFLDTNFDNIRSAAHSWEGR